MSSDDDEVMDVFFAKTEDDQKAFVKAIKREIKNKKIRAIEPLLLSKSELQEFMTAEVNMTLLRVAQLRLLANRRGEKMVAQLRF